MTQRFKSIIIIIVSVTIPILLVWLPADYFDSGESICLSVQLFDMECYGCGMTRSIMHMIHFEFDEAFYYNALGFIVAPILCWVWAKQLFGNINFLRTTKKSSTSKFHSDF